ncbi:MAG: hypothetical protein JNJ54_05250 [Myxococcaceae bacterium]|nr:hypothetical protein [Myxococcaceae bacterium]
MSPFSAEVCFLEGQRPKAGTRTFPIVLKVCAHQPILVSQNAVLAAAVLSQLPLKPGTLEYGFVREAPWGAGSDVREMTPDRPLYFFHDVLEPQDPPLEPGRYELSASAYIFTTGAKKEGYVLKDFRLLEVKASRELNIR